MVSHKNYNLHVIEDFVVLLTSKLITWFIDGSLPRWNPNQLYIYQLEMYMYIGI